MAIVERNPMLEGLRGRVGELVFRVRGERTLVSRRPRRHRPGPRSRERTAALERFRRAVAFAREARHKAAFRSLARLRGGYSPYHLALQDFLSRPEIRRVRQAATGPRRLQVEVAERIAVRAVEGRPVGAAPDARARWRARRLEHCPPSWRAALGAEEGQPAGPDVAATRARASTPAALFFRRTAEERDRPGGSPSARPTPREAQEAARGAGGGEAEGAGGSREGEAQRDRGARRGRERGRERGQEVMSTYWELELPSGTSAPVEIIAWDYAGNDARALWQPDGGRGPADGLDGA